tara:strand:+ start:129 stop:494 length:366 start_codon:yes stop_codon:yes gene_type:complete
MPIDPPKKPEYGNFRKATAGGAPGASWKYNKESKLITSPGGLKFASNHPKYDKVISQMSSDYSLVMGDYDKKKAAYDKEILAASTPIKAARGGGNIKTSKPRSGITQPSGLIATKEKKKPE